MLIEVSQMWHVVQSLYLFSPRWVLGQAPSFHPADRRLCFTMHAEQLNSLSTVAHHGQVSLICLFFSPTDRQLTVDAYLKSPEGRRCVKHRAHAFD